MAEDRTKSKEVLYEMEKDGQLIETVAAIGNGEGFSVLVVDEDKLTWASLAKRGLKTLLAALGPIPSTAAGRSSSGRTRTATSRTSPSMRARSSRPLRQKRRKGRAARPSA